MNLQDEIRELRSLIAAKQAEVEKAQQELSDLLSELEGAALLLRDVPIPKKRSRSRRLSRLRSYEPFKTDSSVGRAVEVLRDAKAPLHIDQIVERIRRGGSDVVKSTLASNVSRAIKGNRVFVRAGKGMIGLQEWSSELSWQ